MTEDAPETGGKRGRISWLRENAQHPLRHPLVLLVIGAVISSYLIPSFTRRWQDHQKALEVRSDLASQIAGSATSSIITSDAIFEGRKRHPSRADRTAWLAWQIQSEAIEARLRAYLTDKTLAGDWFGYMQEVEVFHRASYDPKYDPSALWCVHGSLLATSPAAAAIEREAVREERGVIPRLKKPVHVACQSELPILQAVRTRILGRPYEFALIEDELKAKRTELIERVLDSGVRAF